MAKKRRSASRQRPSHLSRRRPWLAIEALEPRSLLAADSGIVANLSSVPTQTPEQYGAVAMTWGGEQVYALPGRWIVRAEESASRADARLSNAAALSTALAAPAVHGLAQQAVLAGRSASVAGALTADLSIARQLAKDTYLLVGDRRLGANDVAKIFDSLSLDVVVEPDFMLRIESGIPNDPQFSSLWGLHNTGQSGGTADADIDAVEAWDQIDFNVGGETVVVAVIDTGVDYTHTDLAPNMWTNPGEIANNDVDDDGNGFVDDYYGYDFIGDGPGDDNPIDDHFHGTHVAGTIAAAGNNSLGVIGVAPSNVQIMALKFLNSSGNGTTADAIEAIEYATMMKRDYGINVRLSNNSWGGSAHSTALSDAIAEAGAEGILFVASAGNTGADTDAASHFPSTYTFDNVISVAASDSLDRLAYFSNFGQVSVDLAAPGLGILSTTLNQGYGLASGTSMASPHVAGALAVLFSQQPQLSALEARDLLLSHVDVLPTLNGKVASGGRLNLHRLLNAAGVAPVISSIPNQTMTNNQVLDLNLTVTDPDTPAANISYSADVEDYAYVLKQQYAFGAESTSTYNWGGQQEKWFQNASGWFFILPNGNFYRWGGGTPSELLSKSALLVQMHPEYYVTTTRLSSAASILASAPINGTSPAVLTVDPNNNFVGTLRYRLTVSDGNSNDVAGFLVRVNSSGATSQPPVLSPIPNQTMNNSQVLNLNLAATDPDTPAGSLIYTAGLEDYGFVLDQQFGFDAESTTAYNWGGQQDKWLKAGTTWYFILPSGALYRWGGGTPAQMISGSTLVAQLQPIYHTTTTRLSGPTSIAATAPVNGTSPPVLTVDPNNNYVGTLRYQVTVSDGNANDTESFLVTVNSGGATGQPPVLSAIANQTMTNSEVLSLNLAATDPDTPAGSLIYSAGLEDYGFVLDQQYGFDAETTSAYNWGGQQEKWLKAGTTWYFILPSGALYRWGGGAPAQMISGSTLVAQLQPIYHSTTTRLSAPTSIAASAPVNGTSPAVLTVDPNNNFVGTLRYQVTVSDGSASDSKSFLVTVNPGGPVNQPPQLAAIPNQTMTNSQVLSLELSATDPDTPAENLVYSANLDDFGYVLKQQYSLAAESTNVYNWGGQQEKWFKGGTQWYFILPSGAFYRWGGGAPAQMMTTSTLLAQLHTVYYTTTARLGAATSIAATAPVNGTSPPVITVDPNNSFVGTLRCAVTVSDGNSADTKNFLVTVNQT